MNPGLIKYNNRLSRQEFLAKHPGHNSETTVGLTVARFDLDGRGIPMLKQQGMKACVGLEEIKLTMGYDTLEVYIDKKYKPGSCEYRVTKDHENYHVRVFQQAMKFFKPDVEKALKKAVQKLSPVVVSSQAEVDAVIQNQFEQVMKEVQPLIKHINHKIAEKNEKIDTPESYLKTTKLCKKW